eukprot:1850529-Pleurochrysis_carterae.AAC.2
MAYIMDPDINRISSIPSAYISDYSVACAQDGRRKGLRERRQASGERANYIIGTADLDIYSSSP